MNDETVRSLYSALFSQIRRASPDVDVKTVVTLKETDENGEIASVGSGVLLTDEGYILTAAHCTERFIYRENDTHKYVAIIAKKEYPLNSTFLRNPVCDHNLDVSLIKAETNGSPAPNRLGALCRTPDLGEMMYFIDPVAKKARAGPVVPFSGLNWRHLKEETHYMIDTPCLTGSSGGPVFTEDGRFAGIVNAIKIDDNPASILAYFSGREVQGMTGPTVAIRPEAILQWFSDTMKSIANSPDY